MAGGLSAPLLKALDLTDKRRPGFFTSIEDLEKSAPPLPYTHAVRRAWEAMELGGVLYVGRTPAAYFREVPSITDDLARDLQRCLWNHAIAPILVLASATEVRIYSGRVRPSGPDDDPNAEPRLVRTLDIASQVLETRQLVQAIETGHLLSRFPKSFGREYCVDRYLLSNLEDLRKKLSEGTHCLKEEMVHNLLTRLLFTCYLVERKIVEGKHFPGPYLSRLGSEGGLGSALKELEPAEARTTLYTLFRKLKAKFNGTLFTADLDQEERSVQDEHMEVIQAFLQGHDIGKGQLTLGFWAYDFSMIPVETISGIYENFIRAEGEAKQREAGAYYTPPHLAELVIDTALQGRRGSLLDMTVLDPSCGSGIFLVGIFNRMAQEWQSRNRGRQNRTRARELISLLENRIFGVDTEEAACRTACFSLYLALFDQLDPPDIYALEEQGQKLPLLMLEAGKRQPQDRPCPIVCGSFFDAKLPLARDYFDLVVGNPPWVSRGKSKDPLFLEWLSASPGVRAPQKQMAHGFMWKAPDYLADGGTACLLLPSAVLFNRTDRFQEAWFTKFAVEKVVNLSDLSFLLFSGADRPGIIVRFSKDMPTGELIDYESPKTDTGSQLGGPVSICEQDVSSIRLTEVLAYAQAGEAPALWKMHLWGTPRDLRFLARLRDLPQLKCVAGKPKEHKRWLCGQGFQPFYAQAESDAGDKKRWSKPWWPTDRLFLDAKSENLRLLALERDCQPVGDHFRRLRRSPDQRIFEPPLVVVSQGSSKAAFVGFSLLFQDSLQSIKGSADDRALLIFLAAVLNSDLARYFLFHTAANWGTERDKVHFFEMLRLPFPLPEDCPNLSRAKEIVAEVGAKIVGLRKELVSAGDDSGREAKVVQATRTEIEPLVREYYDVDEYEAMLLEDTLKVSEPSSTPASASAVVPALAEPRPEQREAYVSALCDMLNVWASRTGLRVSGEVVSARSAGLALVTVSKGKSANKFTDREAPEDLRDALARISRALPQHEGSFSMQRGLKVFQGNQIHILKPLALRFWTRTAALNDADEIAAAILDRRRGD